MARPISDEELQLKKRARRRLVGAIVVVTAVAVVLPMVLDSEPKPVSRNVDIQIPSPDSGDYKPKASAPIRIAPEAPVTKGPEAAPKAEVASKPEVPPERATAAPEKAPKEKPKVAAKEISTKDAPAAAGAYAIQVEALADPEKAKQLERKVVSAGLQAYTEVTKTKAGETVTRVRAGPYPTPEAAEKARERLKTVGLDGKVVPK